MNDSSSRFWSAVGALAGVAGVLLTYVIWQQSTESDDDPSDASSEVDTGEGVGDNGGDNGDGGDGGGGDGGDGDGDGSWEEYASYDPWLPLTWQEDHCWEQQLDLDDQGYSEAVDPAAGYAPWADLGWYSCGLYSSGYLFGISTSATVGADDTEDLDACRSATETEPALHLELDPDSPTSDEGCVWTSDGRLAAVTVTSILWNGDSAEAELRVTVWERVE